MLHVNQSPVTVMALQASLSAQNEFQIALSLSARVLTNGWYISITTEKAITSFVLAEDI